MNRNLFKDFDNIWFQGRLLGIALLPPSVGSILNWKQGAKSSAEKERWTKESFEESGEG